MWNPQPWEAQRHKDVAPGDVVSMAVLGWMISEGLDDLRGVGFDDLRGFR